jgi:hypothetical protein
MHMVKYWLFNPGSPAAPIASAMSDPGRFCCKSRKSSNPKNLAKVDLQTSLLLRRFFSATTEARDRFLVNRYGPSHRRAQNASAALRIFVRYPKKTFATKSARNRHAAAVAECLVL